MRDANQRLLLHVIERAFVVALRAVELALAFPDDRYIHRQRLRRLAFAQAGHAEQQHEPATLCFIVAAETYSDTTIWPHGAGALSLFVAPNKLRFDRARQAGCQVALTIRQARGCRGGRVSVVISDGRLLSMDLARHSQR